MLGIRPERLAPAADGDGQATLDLMVEVVEPLGSEVMVHGSVSSSDGPTPVTARLESGARPPVGQISGSAYDPAHSHRFDKATGVAI